MTRSPCRGQPQGGEAIAQVVGVAGLMSLFLMIALLVTGPAQAQRPPTVAAASDLQFAIEDLAARFTEETGQRVRLNFGSSGNFRRQIAQGAPFELYMSADEAYVEALYESGHLEDAGDLYAVGRVVLITRQGASLDPEAGLAALAGALEAGEIRRFAIANPEHAPYGVAAKQALQSAGLWEVIQPHLVFGENVSQAAQFALSPDADGGIVAWSLALAPSLDRRSDWALIPEDHHEPLRQRMALVKGAGETARAFYDFILSDPGRAVLAEYGFITPDPD
ncbi:molybdenum ABC transporter, periplasmic molybdate-binding protein [Alkalilimnicola ehrlichii MLHE-1]|uniref:Molybdenum ABC transporter, periplasmic molybdate-binding protein n=2 Tax=Alkalilimnicola ehrlichii TaxID=351052 RepID=Q0A7C0_ALKEH|nr:molybdenum ABC transporter, periplasmic molybdate-binding protein [Alkalilimnicola ehrlichii MLHE-1]